MELCLQLLQNMSRFFINQILLFFEVVRSCFHFLFVFAELFGSLCAAVDVAEEDGIIEVDLRIS